jgi:hypothetical protein
MMSIPSRITMFLIAATLCCTFWAGCRKEGQDESTPPDPPAVLRDAGNSEAADPPAGNVPDWNLGSAATLLLRASDGPALEGKMLLVSTGEGGPAGVALTPNEQYVFVKDKSLTKAEAADPRPHRASWQAELPGDGTYHVWVYAWWFDTCANSIYLNISNGGTQSLPDQTMGEDEVVEKWHWVPLRVPLKLKAGAATVVLKCREDGARVGAVLLTTKSSIPQGPEG